MEDIQALEAMPASDLTPRQIVAELDKFIVGQAGAKRAVAVALRNRVRRARLSDDLRDEVIPKNILMIGPTGVGKTEIARRLAKLAHAPFLKVEATKFTEVGYVGRDVDSIVRDLVQTSLRLVETEMIDAVQAEAETIAVDKIVDILQPRKSKAKRAAQAAQKAGESAQEQMAEIQKQMAEMGTMFGFTPLGPVMPGQMPNQMPRQTPGSGPTLGSSARSTPSPAPNDEAVDEDTENAEPTEYEKKKTEQEERVRERLREQVAEGSRDTDEIEIEVDEGGGGASAIIGVPFMGGGSGGPGGGDGLDLGDLLGQLMPRRKKSRKVSIGEAKKILTDEAARGLLDKDAVQTEAVRRAEENGIVFLDEIDKVAGRRGEGGGGGPDVSREGVQRDLLPIIEGSTVQTKYGPVRTNHVLFIAAGAFSVSKPSDLIPELQGRLPIRVELDSLTEGDFRRILTEPKNALTRQYEALLQTEDVTITFADEAVAEIARIAVDVNGRTENIGARRLHTVMERLLEELSFEAPDGSPKTVEIDAAFVRERLKDVAEDEDLSRYIL